MKQLSKQSIAIICTICIIGTGLLVFALVYKFRPIPDLPTINIQLEDNYPFRDIDRINYINAKVKMNNAKDYNFGTKKAEIRGRGNDSWSHSRNRKSFKLKFDDPQPLFGEASNQHWVLINYRKEFQGLGQTVASKFSGIEWNSSVNYVNLKINGSYRGVYVLLEHIEIDEGRLNLQSESGIEDTGYLLELDNHGFISHGIPQYENVDYFLLNNFGRPFTMHAPTNISDNQIQYIKSFVQNVFDLGTNNDPEFEEIVDMPSLLDMYLVNEFMVNKCVRLNIYMYKKPNENKLYFGPPWDLDARPSMTTKNAQSLISTSSGFNNVFFDYLEDNCQDLIKHRWDEMSPIVQETMDKFFKKHKSYFDDATNMHKWYKKRLKWLNEYWAI